MRKPSTAPSRRRGLSARWKLTIAITAVAIAASGALWIVTALFVLRYIPSESIVTETDGRWVAARGDIVRVFMPIATSAFFAVAGLSLFGGWFLAGRILRPLSAIATVAHHVENGDLSIRVALPGPKDEFRDVADAFDSMLESVQGNVESQQRFAANASHELRTPLASTSSLLEVARADPTRDIPTLLKNLQILNTRAVSSTNALLLLSRLDNSAPELTPTDLSIAAEEAIEALSGIAEKHGVALTSAISPAFVRGDASLLERLASNLLHNAIVHNQAQGERRTAHIEVEVHNAHAVLRVTNSGPIISASVLPTLVEPFTRSERTTRDGDSHSGSGLGLALCSTIVRVHGGSFVLRAPATGGLDITARFALN